MRPRPTTSTRRRRSPPIGEARTALRDRLIQRIIENRLQLQQAEREKIAVEDVEIAEQMADIMKKMNAKNEAELEQALRQQGVTAESIKKRIRDQIMVDRIRRRRVNLRVTVTEQEIDRYVLQQNREKLETGLTFEARHILFLPDPNRGEDGWEDARRRAADTYDRVLGGARFRRARQGAVTGRLRQGRRLAGHAQARRAGAGYRGRHSSTLDGRDVGAVPLAGRVPPLPPGFEGSALGRWAHPGAQPDPRHPCCGRSWRSGCASGSPRFGSAPSSTCGCDPRRQRRARAVKNSIDSIPSRMGQCPCRVVGRRSPVPSDTPRRSPFRSAILSAARPHATSPTRLRKRRRLRRQPEGREARR